MPDLTIQVQEIKSLPNTALVVLNGSIDAKTVITFQTHLSSVRERGIERFIMDMENVKYVNSTGLGYLINLSDSVSPNQGGISLVRVQPKVKVVFDMLGLNAFFKIFQTREEALKHLSSMVEGAAAGPREATATLKGREATPLVQPAVRPPVAPARAAPTTPRVPVPAAPPAPAPAPAETLHVECQSCKALLAIREVGTYKCPRCLVLFNYVGSGRVSFLPRQKVLPVQMSLNFSPECVEGLLEFVRRLAGRVGFDGSAVSEIQAAVQEAVDTIRRHSYGGNENNVYHVLMIAADSELEIRFADYGVSLNADRADLFPSARRIGDRFELKNHPKGGNVITLCKKVK